MGVRRVDRNGAGTAPSPEHMTPDVNIVPIFERRLGYLESEIVLRDVQIESLRLEIQRLVEQLANPPAMVDVPAKKES